MMSLKEDILDISRQNTISDLTPWFDRNLDDQIKHRMFQEIGMLTRVSDSIESYLRTYSKDNNINTVVIGMSGGVDSALTASLFKRAGWDVIGGILPIHQNPEETERGIRVCEHLGIPYFFKNLSGLYSDTLHTFSTIDETINWSGYGAFNVPTDIKIRRGNIRARLRMITLYNIASMKGGLVASTDNLSELGAGFWTLHGDVGDVAPIQSLMKSWDVPALAREHGLPESVWRATPTDGLGISSGDESQLGATYLEWDIMVNAIHEAIGYNVYNLETLKSSFNLEFEPNSHEHVVFENVINRMQKSWFKRVNPINVPHPFVDRYDIIDRIDRTFFRNRN